MSEPDHSEDYSEPEDYSELEFGAEVLSEERKEQFWEMFGVLLSEFPEVMVGFDETLEGLTNCGGREFDPESPKFFQGFVLVASVRNLDGWESVFFLNPTEQSEFMTKGLTAAAHEMQIRI